jgi:hypothetical protein
MRCIPPLAVAAALFLASAAHAIDYAKIDRTIRREPVYQTKAPKYALLLFGPEAKVRVWIVVDGQTVYLDRNADGDLTAKNERFENYAACKDIEIVDPDGKTRYLFTSMSEYKHGEPPQPHLMVNVEIKGPVCYRQYCDVGAADTTQKAALAHFHGPLAMWPRTIWWKIPPELALKAGDQPVDLLAGPGTMDAKAGCWVVVCTHHGNEPDFPKGVVPVADIEFPPATPGGRPIKKRYHLEHFC